MTLTKQLMTGNEAIACGFWEAGGRVVAAYPGTPSTEITENAAKYSEIHAEWAPNEKVALEVGIGAAIAGARSLVAMKHVGLNVAADPLFTAAYTGVNGGLVIVSADDPGMHSSQNEQDNRYYGRAAKVPVLEPSDSAEAKEFTKMALAVSEEFDTPVILRLTTRIAHSQSLVELDERQNLELKDYVKDEIKYVMVPAHARKRRVVVEQRLEALAVFSDNSPLNRIELSCDTSCGIIASGAIYQYVKEVLPEASVLKIGMSYPLPKKLIQEFASKVDKLYVIEELEPFMEDAIKSWGIPVEGRSVFSALGEIFAEDIQNKLGDGLPVPPAETSGIPVRPPVLCPGCPHRGVFHVLHQMKLTVSGDIGCYTLGCLPPLSAIDTTVCMGYSVSGAHGMEMARGKDFAKHTVAVIGESTFIHSGITGLINSVYNGGTTTTLILDNSITAMTGHQENPATGRNAKGEPAPQLDLVKLVKACGVKRVREVDPFDIKSLRQMLKEELAAEEVSVIITRRPCILINRQAIAPALIVDPEKCTNCGNCMKIGCPCIGKAENHVVINASQCVGCGLCEKLCGFGAIGRDGGKNE